MSPSLAAWASAVVVVTMAWPTTSTAPARSLPPPGDRHTGGARSVREGVRSGRLGGALERRRTAAAVERSAPDAIDLLVLVTRAGLTPHQAVRSLVDHAPAACRPGFAEVVRRIDRGSGLADALTALPDVLGASMATAADTLSIAERYGTPIGEALDHLSLDVRQRRRHRAEAAARRLPVQLSFPLVLCTLPSFVLVAVAPAVLAALSSLGAAW